MLPEADVDADGVLLGWKNDLAAETAVDADGVMLCWKKSLAADATLPVREPTILPRLPSGGEDPPLSTFTIRPGAWLEPSLPAKS